MRLFLLSLISTWINRTVHAQLLRLQEGRKMCKGKSVSSVPFAHRKEHNLSIIIYSEDN